jgi:hypothetical protein
MLTSYRKQIFRSSWKYTHEETHEYDVVRLNYADATKPQPEKLESRVNDKVDKKSTT